MAAAKRTTGAEEWWQTLPEKDVFQHSQNFACYSIAPPCQKRVPAKDERMLPADTSHVLVARDACVNNLDFQRNGALADSDPVFEDMVSEASVSRSIKRDGVNVWAAGPGLRQGTRIDESNPVSRKLNAGHLTTRRSGLSALNQLRGVRHGEHRSTTGRYSTRPMITPTGTGSWTRLGCRIKQIIQSRRGAEFIRPIAKPMQRGRARGGPPAATGYRRVAGAFHRRAAVRR